MIVDIPEDRLPCGAATDEILDQVAGGRADERDPHQASCPHCQAALAEYDRLWAPVREVAHTEVTAPGSVLDEAIRRIRGTASDPMYGTISSADGTIRIAARVVVIVARQTTQDIAGVRVALSKLLTPGANPAAGTGSMGGVEATPTVDNTADARSGHARVVAGVSGTSTAIEVTLAADYGTDLVALGERIRAEVSDRIRYFTGLNPVAVTVRIDDVFD